MAVPLGSASRSPQWRVRLRGIHCGTRKRAAGKEIRTAGIEGERLPLAVRHFECRCAGALLPVEAFYPYPELRKAS